MLLKAGHLAKGQLLCILLYAQATHVPQLNLYTKISGRAYEVKLALTYEQRISSS